MRVQILEAARQDKVEKILQYLNLSVDDPRTLRLQKTLLALDVDTFELLWLDVEKHEREEVVALINKIYEYFLLFDFVIENQSEIPEDLKKNDLRKMGDLLNGIALKLYTRHKIGLSREAKLIQAIVATLGYPEHALDELEEKFMEASRRLFAQANAEDHSES